jgi:hypothetical protein
VVILNALAPEIDKREQKDKLWKLMDKYLLRYHEEFLKDIRSSFILMRAYL